MPLATPLIKSKKRPTLGDVAKVAKVSEMTVSRVLSGKSKVSDATKGKVKKVIEQLGYVPNHLAGSLATSRSNQVAVIIPSLMNNVFPEVMAGITDHLERAGYNAVIGISDYNVDKEESLIRSMVSWRPAGIILVGSQRSPSARNILRNASVPVVEIMELYDDPIDICVGLDHREAGAAIAAHLIARGYRRFGYVGFHEIDSSAARRFHGIREVLERSGQSIKAEKLFERPPDIEMGKEGLASLLEMSADLEAVFFSNDTAAIGGLLLCWERGIDVPGQLAVAGFSGLKSGQVMPRKLTTIATERYKIGTFGARAVLNRLDGQPVSPRLDLGFYLIEGETA